MRKQVESSQRKARTETFRLVSASVPSGTAAESAAGCPEGYLRCTVLKNGTGDFTINFIEPFQRIPNVIATPVSSAASVKAVLHASTSASLVRVLVRNDSGTLTDPTELHVTVLGYDTADQVR